MRRVTVVSIELNGIPEAYVSTRFVWFSFLVHEICFGSEHCLVCSGLFFYLVPSMSITAIDSTGCISTPGSMFRVSPATVHPLMYDGVFVVDGLAWKYGVDWIRRIAIILEEIMKTVGVTCLMLVYTGPYPDWATLCDCTYHQMLKVLMYNLYPPKWIVWISMGNDIMDQGKNLVDMDKVVNKVVENGISLLDQANLWVPQNQLIYGGSAAMWLHKTPGLYTEAFEDASEAVVMSLRRKGCHCCL